MWNRWTEACYIRKSDASRSRRLMTNLNGWSSAILADPRARTIVRVCRWHAVIGRRVKFIKLPSDRTSHRITPQVCCRASYNSARQLFHPSVRTPALCTVVRYLFSKHLWTSLCSQRRDIDNDDDDDDVLRRFFVEHRIIITTLGYR